jgi:hypothetical protein
VLAAAGRVEQFALRVGDVVNPMMRPAGVLGLPILGGLLGHTQPATTSRYAHLANDPLKAANELIGARLDELMGQKPD